MSSSTPFCVQAKPKGQQTHAALLDAALALASLLGLEGITIGALAERVGMSKSGVFAHFGSREDLQIAVVQAYFRRFEDEVFRPALAHPHGLPRLRALFDLWMHRVTQELQSGCIFISGAVEFDDREGAVRDALLQAVTVWMQAMHRAIAQAREQGHLHPDTDAEQMAFEIHSLILGVHYKARFMQHADAIERARKGFDHIVARFGADAGATLSPT